MAPRLQTGNFSALPNSAKIFILFALIGLLSAGYYLGLHMGVEDDTRRAELQHNSLQNELKQATDQQKEFLKLREELASREAINRQMIRVLPESSEIPAFLDDLNRLAELSGLEMHDVKPMPEQSSEFYIKVPIQIGLTGRYHQLSKFFYNISRLERAINMEDISLLTPKKVGDEVHLKVSVLATTFRRASDAAAAAAGDGA